MEPVTEYRRRIQEIFHRIERAFENIDPDLVECENSMGALTLTFADQSRCILSAQPSVSQLWLAVASQGTAYHFNFLEDSQAWMDDKGRSIELIQFLENHVKEVAHVAIKI